MLPGQLMCTTANKQVQTEKLVVARALQHCEREADVLGIPYGLNFCGSSKEMHCWVGVSRQW